MYYMKRKFKLWWSILLQISNWTTTCTQFKEEMYVNGWVRLGIMVLNSTFNNISVIWWSVLLVEVTGVSEINHQPAASHWQTLSKNVVSSTVLPMNSIFKLTTLMVIGTDCIGNYKSNYHTITATTTPHINVCNTQLIKVENGYI